MKFASTLQTFTTELGDKQPDLNVAFYFAGSPDWERTIKADAARFSGSFSRQVDMPALTPEASKEMLDRRFEAFSINPDNRRTVELERVQHIHRFMQHNHLDITY